MKVIKHFLWLFIAMGLSWLTTFSLVSLKWILDSWIVGVLLLFICIYYILISLLTEE